MRTTIPLLLSGTAACLLGLPLPAQTCVLAIPENGKSTLAIQTFSGPMFTDPKFMKGKEEKKDEVVAAFNAGVRAGTVPAASNAEMVFTITKAVVEAGDEYTIGYNVGGTDYFSYVVCKDDTLYICRNRGPVFAGPPEDPIGFSLQGVQKVPVHLKVGDILQPFEDASFIFPTTTDMTVKKRVFSHMGTSSKDGFGFATDSRTGEQGFGKYTTTTTKAVYKSIDVAVRQSLGFSAHSLQGMNAQVTGEEEVTVGGVKYRAFIIESESWTKGQMNITYESADEEVNREQEANMARLQGKQERLMVRKGFTNKLGYMVMYSKTWFVPQLGGAVITESYDPTGAITSIMRTVSIL
ncbi:MAG: hypothetical protein IPM46_14270 [Flavobacteriales bacterium]|nr:hypothetical protein [Flavobacteriales bacterium]